MGNLNDNVTFEELLNNSFKQITVGSAVTGTIININEAGEIFVDIGYKADGIIPKAEYSYDINANPKEDFKIGDKIKADVLKLNDGLGNVLLSYKRAFYRTTKKDFEKKVSEKYIFEEFVDEVNENGLIVNYHHIIRIFIPISLSNLARNEDIQTVKGRKIQFRVIEYDEKTRKIIASVKDVVEEEKKKQLEEFWNQVEVGKKYKGTVTSISSYGAFVDIGGVQGLLHISEMAWGRNQSPSDILTVGQEIEVKIKNLDRENHRLMLSYEKKGPNPWSKVSEKYHINDIIKVKVIKLMPFGAFVELEKGIEGLVHISQICEKKISKPEEELVIGKKVNAKIIDMDVEKQKMELSIRELEGTSYEYKEE